MGKRIAPPRKATTNKVTSNVATLRNPVNQGKSPSINSIPKVKKLIQKVPKRTNRCKSDGEVASLDSLFKSLVSAQSKAAPTKPEVCT
jgi:hypothetical protein